MNREVVFPQGGNTDMDHVPPNSTAGGRCLLRRLQPLVLFLCCCGMASAEEWRFSDSQTAVSTGAQLERQRRWRDAIDLYKTALGSWPQDTHISYGLRRSQFQFAIERRYSDQSFQEQLLPLKRDEALALFHAVLTRVQDHFIDPINTTSVVAHGTESLWLALANEKFLERNLFGADETRLAALRQTLKDKYWNAPVYYQDGARKLIIEICDLCRKSVGLNEGAVVMEFVFGACNCLDDYSNVLSPTKRTDLHSSVRGRFTGIGIVMEAEPGEGMKLLQVLPDSPAAEQGLRRGDHLVSINGIDVRKATTDEAAAMLQGLPGSKVKLEAVGATAGDPPKNVVCTRREVVVRSIPVAEIVDTTEGIGYLQMTGFQDNTPVELDAALNKLRGLGMKSLIWDLRGNPGGSLPAAVDVCDRFIDEGVIVSTKGRNTEQNQSYTAMSPGTWDIPVVLLIDGHSASASEIVAGAIRDHRRGTVVGRKSFGKWSVQSLYDDLPLGCGVRLTTAKFYSPDGHNLSKIGVKPDVEVKEGDAYERPLGQVDVEKDPDVQMGLSVLRQKNVTQR